MRSPGALNRRRGAETAGPTPPSPGLRPVAYRSGDPRDVPRTRVGTVGDTLRPAVFGDERGYGTATNGTESL